MGYHYNSDTGKYGVCSASKKECPYVYGETLEEAQAQYEKSMQSEIVKPINKKLMRQQLRDMPAEILSKTPLKELDTAQLVQTIVYETKKIGIDEEDIKSSISLATILHAHQKRGNRGNFTTTPYIEHPLRNALRLIRLGVKNKDVIVAAILHDTVEDGAKSFVEKFKDYNSENIHELDAREELKNHIKNVYGKNSLRIIDAVTNDYIADTDKEKMSAIEKNRIYLEHVKNNIKNNPEVYLVKVSDFIDNATGLYHNDIPSRSAKTLKQAVKYLPVVEHFISSLKEMNPKDLGIDQKGVNSILDHLYKTEVRLQKIIDKYSDD